MKRIKAFTLVELIVVITIVGILSTVGFVSYSGYLTSARDSNRISQLTKLSDSLQVYSASKSLPLPDDKIDITASGASNIIAYQGYVGVDVLETIDYTNGGKDPKDDGYYTYYLTRDRKSMQLLALMEEPQTVAYKGIIPSVADTYAATYEDRYPKVYGRKLGVLTQATTNTPAQEVTSVKSIGNLDIVNTTDQYVSHITDEEKLEGIGSIIQESIPTANCKRIKQTGGAKGNGIYEINPAGTEDTKVYCDMETAGGGWTLVARTHKDSIGINNFGWLGKTGDVTSYTEAYSLGSTIKNIGFSKIMIVSKNDQQVTKGAVLLEINPSFFKTGINNPNSSLSSQNDTTNCKVLYNYSPTTYDVICGNNYNYWGGFGYNQGFMFNRQDNISDGRFIYSQYLDTYNNGMIKDKDSGGTDPSYDNFRGDQGMLFVK